MDVLIDEDNVFSKNIIYDSEDDDNNLDINLDANKILYDFDYDIDTINIIYDTIIHYVKDKDLLLCEYLKIEDIDIFTEMLFQSI